MMLCSWLLIVSLKDFMLESINSNRKKSNSRCYCSNCDTALYLAGHPKLSLQYARPQVLLLCWFWWSVLVDQGFLLQHVLSSSLPVLQGRRSPEWKRWSCGYRQWGAGRYGLAKNLVENYRAGRLDSESRLNWKPLILSQTTLRLRFTGRVWGTRVWVWGLGVRVYKRFGNSDFRMCFV